jgi:hypothetical protein
MHHGSQKKKILYLGGSVEKRQEHWPNASQFKHAFDFKTPLTTTTKTAAAAAATTTTTTTTTTITTTTTTQMGVSSYPFDHS